jgi:F-type H+-transporting ATPase subunit a
MNMSALASFAEASPHISISSDVLFRIGPVPISNSFLLGLLGYTIIVTIFLLAVRLLKQGSRSLFMHGVLWVFEMLFGAMEQVLGSRERAKKLAPLAITLFIALLLNNWLGLLPFVGPITWNGKPLFRGLAADLNTTLALAVISMVTVQLWAIKTFGFFGNAKRYLRNPLKDPLGAFEGFLELIAELSRLIALCMRLFGNVLGGEILLAVIGFITSYGAPLVLPVFMGLELFVGAVQAYVFFMLTIVFISLGSTSHDHHVEAETTIQSLDTKPVAFSSGIDSR